MPCEHHKNALIEAAASGTDLARAPDSNPEFAALRAHLESCASCRAAFAQEQALFAAIDSGLHSSANAEVPPSLLPRVRAGLDEVTIAHSRWSSGWSAMTGAVVAAAALFFIVSVRHGNLRTLPTNSATNRSPAAPQINPTRQAPLTSKPSEKVGSVPQPRMSVARNSEPLVKSVSRNSVPEILVPRDQELLLTGYARQWSSRQRAPLVTGDADQTAMAFLEVAPIQIAELDVKPLAEGNSQ